MPKVKWALGPRGTLVVGCPAEYTFDILSPDDEVLRVTRPYRSVAISDEEKDFLAAHAGIGSLPDEKPAYARLIIPGDGRIWVRPSFPSRRVPLPQETFDATGVSHTWVPSSAGSLDVFSSDGRWLAVVKLPQGIAYSGFPNEPSMVIRGDTIWAVARDSFDVEYVDRYEVPRLSDLDGGSAN
ncbi:MAG: hypothetical protein U5R14_15400 [Gemmatimonadota bacterium]|nr:hypothetical protein [Gemmatimonadota bacterium]